MSFLDASGEEELKHQIFGLQEDNLTGRKILDINYVPVRSHTPQAR